MVETKDYIKTFLQAKDVGQDTTVTILNEGSFEESDYGQQLIVLCEVAGNKMSWAVNKTNTRTLNEMFKTTDTKGWVDKPFKLKKVLVMVKGEEKESLRAYPLEELLGS